MDDDERLQEPGWYVTTLLTAAQYVASGEE